MQFGKVNIVKNLDHGLEARTKLVEGINKLADAVGSTLGASGRSVVLEDDFGNPHVTKDGVTVAKYITLEDPVENLGAMMMRQASTSASSKAGDGTTTATVIAQALIKAYLKNSKTKTSFRDITHGIKQARDHVIGFLEKKSLDMDNGLLYDVAKVSANNDAMLGRVIAEAFVKAGDNGVVSIESNDSIDTVVESQKGTAINTSVLSHHFYTNKDKQTAELDNPLILLSKTEIPNIRKIQDILEYAIKKNRSILFIAPMAKQPLAALAMNQVKGNIKCACIEPPGFGEKRNDVLDDIALLTGAIVLDESLGDSMDLITEKHLGLAQKASINSQGTILTFSGINPKVQDKIVELKMMLQSEDNITLIKHIENRLAILSGGVAVIKVGADSEVELKEKLDRVEDAVAAVRAAKKEGVLPGGGAALYGYTLQGEAIEIDPKYIEGWTIFTRAIREPLIKILDNAGIHQFKDPKKWGWGIDATDAKAKDMIKAGIIDPLLVTKHAVNSAVSVATTILSTDAVVSNIRK